MRGRVRAGDAKAKHFRDIGMARGTCGGGGELRIVKYDLWLGIGGQRLDLSRAPGAS